MRPRVHRQHEDRRYGQRRQDRNPISWTSLTYFLSTAKWIFRRAWYIAQSRIVLAYRMVKERFKVFLHAQGLLIGMCRLCGQVTPGKFPHPTRVLSRGDEMGKGTGHRIIVIISSFLLYIIFSSLLFWVYSELDVKPYSITSQYATLLR
jgi:hypothetical protein